MKDQAIIEKIKKLMGEKAVTLEYYCRECGYLLYRTINSDELNKGDSEIDEILYIPCYQCDESEMEVVNVYDYEEWIKDNPHYVQGG